MNNAKKIADEIHDVADGFAVLPVPERPPRVKWGDEYLSWTDEKKIQYLQKFCEAMNHAAATLQVERDKLGRLAELKEQQLIKMKEMMDANNYMLQHEVTRMNEQRQFYHAEVARLNKIIRDGNHQQYDS